MDEGINISVRSDGRSLSQHSDAAKSLVLATTATIAHLRPSLLCHCPGAPAQLCHHAHSASEQTQVLSQLQLLFPKEPELLARHEELLPITEPAALPSSTSAAAQPAASTATPAAVSKGMKASSSSSSSSRTTVAVMNVGGRLLPVPAAGMSKAAVESAFPALPGTSKPANGAAAAQPVQSTSGSKVWGPGPASATTAPAAAAETTASSSASSPVSANDGLGEPKQQEGADIQGAVSEELWSFLFLGPTLQWSELGAE